MKKIFLALDNLNRSQLKEAIKTFAPLGFSFKIGMETFYRFGREALDLVQQDNRGLLFLDLKLHDIPQTVARSIEVLSEDYSFDFLTVHAHGGETMLAAAQQAISNKPIKLLAVSFLTSLDEQELATTYAINSSSDYHKRFNDIVAQVKKAKIEGIICSGMDAKEIPYLVKVCPGIRFKDEVEAGNIQDQRKVSTPEMAFANGADYIVMGRSILQAQNIDDRVQELEKILQQSECNFV